jgi:hypothetical protein
MCLLKHSLKEHTTVNNCSGKTCFYKIKYCAKGEKKNIMNIVMHRPTAKQLLNKHVPT